jgi:6,7-dimethyl-8-ribityllumazine synthase
VRIAILVARFNGVVTGSLLRGARGALAHRGCPEPEILYCGGAWELPVMASRLMRRPETNRPTGIVALGCVVRGETPHFDFVAGEATAGLGRVATETGVPVGLGVLTTDTIEQAFARVEGAASNKGWEATLTVLDVIAGLDEVSGLDVITGLK